MGIGFSTGSLTLGDFQKGIDWLRELGIRTIELSSLREYEISAFESVLDEIDVSSFDYVSFHAPSHLEELTEKELVRILLKVSEKNWSIIVHPNIITDFALWRSLGESLCIENMDKRKPVGRTTGELEGYFCELPNAGFCLDVAHARQVDPTMSTGLEMLEKFAERLRQLHVSVVNTLSKHESLNFEAMLAYSKLAGHVPNNVPIILESPVGKHMIRAEVEIARQIFDKKEREEFLAPYRSTSSYFFENSVV